LLPIRWCRNSPAMDKNAYVISLAPLFKNLPADSRQQIQSIAVEKMAEKGEIIYFEGDICDGFYLVAEGQVKIHKLSPEGKEKILHFFGVGEPFGEVAMFIGTQYPANAQAVEKCRLLFFPKTAFMRVVADHPALSLNMLAILSRRLKLFTSQIEELALKDVPGRLAGYFMLLAEEQADSRQVTLNITKGQLASLLGTIPETLSRMMAKLTQLGFIDVQGKNIRLLNLQGLRQLAEEGRLGET